MAAGGGDRPSSTSPSQSLSTPSQLTSTGSYPARDSASGAIQPAAPAQTLDWPAHTPLFWPVGGGVKPTSTAPSQSLSNPSQLISIASKPSIVP